MTAGEGAAGTSATVWEEVELVAGRRTGDGAETGLVADALVGHVVGSGAGTELEAGAEDEAGVMAGAAAGF